MKNLTKLCIFSCKSHLLYFLIFQNRNAELILVNHVEDNDDFGGWGDEPTVATFDKQSEVINKVLVVTFTVKNPENSMGKYDCQISSTNQKSLFPVEIKDSNSPWAEWSEWSKCNNEEEVGKAMVNRQRLANLLNPQTQQRHCRCSDLKELPRPRYFHLLLLPERKYV